MNLLFITIISIALLALASPNSYSPIVLKSAIGIPMITLFFLMWVYSWKGDSTLRIKVNSLHTPIIGFFIWASISALWSVNDFYALTMLMQFLSYVLVFILVYNLLNNIKQLKLVVFSFVIIGTVVSSIGLFQYYLTDNIVVQNLFTQGAWPASTFGNKNFAMHFIVMVVPIAILSLLRATSVQLIWLFAFLLLINLWYWLFSFTRAAWLAVAIQVAFLIIFFVIDRMKNKKNSIFNNLNFLKHKLLSVFVITVSLILVSSFNPHSEIQPGGGGIQNRLQSISIESGKARFPAWLNTIEMIKEQPFSGVGIGQWSIHYPLYHDKAAPDKLFNEDSALRHLHNEYLEMLANFGLIGYLFLLWIFILSVLIIFRLLTLRFDERKIYVLAASLPLLGFLVESFFSFPIKAYYPMLFVMILLAILAHLYDLIYLENKPRIYTFDIRSTRIKRLSFYAFNALLFSFVVLLFYYSYNWVMAEKYREHAYEFERNQYFNLTKVATIRSKSYLSNLPDLHNLLGLSYLNLNDNEGAIDALKYSLQLQPYQSSALFNLSLAYRKLKNHKKELEVLKRLVKINPGHFRAHAAIARIYYILNEIPKAEKAYNNMKVHFSKQKNRAGFSPHYSVVGKTAILVKDFEFAKLVYTEYLKKDPSAENFQVLGTLYLHNAKNIQDRAKGVDLFIRSLKLNPKIDERELMMDEIMRFELEDAQ